MGFAAEAGFFLGGERGHYTQKKGVTIHRQATDFQGKKSSASSIRIVSYCKYDTYKYDMYSIVGIDKKRMEKELVIVLYMLEESVKLGISRDPVPTCPIPRDSP